MKCFHHQTDDAIGLCVRCSRALCALCASEVNGVLACKGCCEDDIRVLEEIHLRKKQQGEAAARAIGIGMGGTLGIMLAAPGGYALWLGWQQHFTYYYVVGGILFGLGALVLVLIGIFISQKKSVR